MCRSRMTYPGSQIHRGTPQNLGGSVSVRSYHAVAEHVRPFHRREAKIGNLKRAVHNGSADGNRNRFSREYFFLYVSFMVAGGGT